MIKAKVLKELRNELTREVSEELKLVSFKESRNGEAVVLVKDVIRAIDTLIYSKFKIRYRH